MKKYSAAERLLRSVLSVSLLIAPATSSHSVQPALARAPRVAVLAERLDDKPSAASTIAVSTGSGETRGTTDGSKITSPSAKTSQGETSTSSNQTTSSDETKVDATTQDSKNPSKKVVKNKKRGNKNFLWKVVGKDGKYFYLMGSMHMVRSGQYPLQPSIEKAFTESDLLVVEVSQKDLTPKKLSRFIIDGMYLNGEKLDQHISEKTRNQLEEFTKAKGSAGVLPQGFQYMKPWLAALTIQVSAMQQLGFEPKLGLEKHFEKEAEEASKPIKGLETAEFQAGLLSGFSDELQDKLLAATLIDMKQWAESINEIEAAWESGDVKAMDKLVTQSFDKHPDLAEVKTKLIDERNVNMAKDIEQLAAGKERIFVLVGAAHLVGEKGLLNLLKHDKYKLTQVTKK